MTIPARNASRRPAGSVSGYLAGIAPVCLFIWLALLSCPAASCAAGPLSFSGRPEPGQPAGPALTLIFVANSKGSLFPCATCSSYAAGGISRRFFRLAQMRQSGAPLLYIAGPYEFPPDAKASEPPLANDAGPASPKLHLALHDALGVDAGWLSPASEAWFFSGAGKFPKGYSTVKKSPETRLLSVFGTTIGLVFFPEIAEPSPEPDAPDSIQAQCLKAGRTLGAKADFIIGVSPWGMDAERDFLSLADGVFNLILGAGEGLGFAQAFDSRAPGVLWMRSDSLGRGMTILELEQLPTAGQYPWIPGVTFNSRLEPLHPSIPTVPEIDALIEGGGEKPTGRLP